MLLQRTGSPVVPAACELQAGFVDLLPRIERCLRHEFRMLSPDAAEEAVTEGIASSFQAYARLYERGRTSAAYASTLATFAARQVRAGRKVGASLKVGDVLYEYARANGRLPLRRLSQLSEARGAWAEAVLADKRTSVPERVALRIDLPQWFKGLTARMRRIAKDLAMGCTTREVALKYGLTPGRISQIRKELYQSWQKFQRPKEEAAS